LHGKREGRVGSVLSFSVAVAMLAADLSRRLKPNPIYIVPEKNEMFILVVPNSWPVTSIVNAIVVIMLDAVPTPVHNGLYNISI